MHELNSETILRALRDFPRETCVDSEVLKWYVSFMDLLRDWVDLHTKCECGRFHCLSCTHYHGFSKGCSWGKEGVVSP
jgi:hypothetical protein